MRTLTIVLIPLILLSCGGDKSSNKVADNIDPASLSTSLCGEFHSAGAMYDVFIFHGDGTGEVSASGIWGNFEFIQVYDTMYILPDQSYFTMKVQPDGKLQGFGDWVGDFVYEKIANDTTKCQAPGPDVARMQKRLLFTKIMVTSESGAGDNAVSLEALCDAEFSDACLALANIAMSEAVAKSIFNTDKQNPDDRVLAYIQKSIDMGDPAGLTKMGEYYLILYDNDKAREYYARACAQQDDKACMKMMEEGWQ